MENQSRRSVIKAVSASVIGAALSDKAIASEPPAETKPFVIRNSESKDEYHFWGMDLYLKVSANDSNEQLSLFYGTYHKGVGPPLHIHHDQDEQFYILEGEALFQVGKDKHTLRAGDTIYLPKNIPHTFLVLSETSKMLFQVEPSGKIEVFFKKLANIYKTATMDDVKNLMASHNQTLAGPPLSAK